MNKIIEEECTSTMAAVSFTTPLYSCNRGISDSFAYLIYQNSSQEFKAIFVFIITLNKPRNDDPRTR